MTRKSNALLVMFFVTCAASVLAETPKPALVVCYTTGNADRRQAKRATKSMLEVMERLAGLPTDKYKAGFTSSPQKCLDSLKDKSTHFISPSLGFFLRYRREYHLKPMVWPRIKGKSTGRWYVVVRRGTYTDIRGLKGKTLGGVLTNDPEFLGRVVFKCRFDPRRFFVLKHSTRVLRDLRKLARGKLDAVILDDKQYNAMGSLPFGKDLTAVFTSDPLPVPSILAVGHRTNAREIGLFTKALSGFCRDSKGKVFCNMFGIDAFVPVDKGAYRGVERLWDKCKVADEH